MRQNIHTIGCWSAIIITMLAAYIAAHMDTDTNYRWPASHPEYNDFRN
jgi:hypothetical protein